MRKQPKALSLFLAVLALLYCGATSALGAPAVTQLRTLIIHADALFTPVNGARVTDMEDLVFNDATNVSDALFDATYGHFRLAVHGVNKNYAGADITPVPVKSITVDLTGTDTEPEDPQAPIPPALDPVFTDAATMENAMVAGLPHAFKQLDLKFDPANYDRYIICLPNGTDNYAEIDPYGYYEATPTAPLRSIFDEYWTGRTFDGILYALGNNFGFGSSGQGADAFGDTTCAMGTIHHTTLDGFGNVTATYGAVKKYQKGWFGAFANTTADLTQDATFDLYPISKNPDTVPGMRMVSINGTNYRISYRRQFDPFAWLRYSSQADQVYVHSDNDLEAVSYVQSQLPENSSTLLSGTVVFFESYGPGNAYATVSFDLDDGNTRPVADSRFIAMRGNASQNFTLTGSDAEGDSLNFAVLTQPAIGTLTGTAPNLTYTPPTDFLGQTSFTFRVDDGKIGAVGTVTIEVNEPNIVPVANPMSITAFNATPEPFTLTGSDGDGDPLTYFIVDAPANGVLSGTAPDLIYTPNNGFSGQDSFTFKVNDFYDDSPAATVTIDVLTVGNVPPTVNAGADQSVELQSLAHLPGLFYGTVPGNMDSTTPNPETELITNVGAYTEDSIADNTTEIYTGQIYDFDGNISFTEKIDDQTKVWIDGVLVLNDGTWWRRTSTANLNLTPGWHDIEIRISNGGGGSGPVNGEVGIGFDPNGGNAWQPLADPGDGSFLRVERTFDLAEASLSDADVTDPEHAPTYLWTDTGTGTGTGTVTFSDPTALNPDVSFTAVGTYVLRLTANDTYDTSFDEVTITVTLAGNNEPVVDAGTNQSTPIGGSNLWDPSSATPLTWHDASDAGTLWADDGVTPATGTVQRWDDKSGNGNHMKQTNASNQPSTAVRAINGLNAIDFDGSDWLREDSNAFGATITDAFAFMVVERDRPHFDREDFFALNPGNWFLMSWQWDNPDAMFRFRSNGSGMSKRRYAPNTSGTATLLATYDSDTQDVKQLWINGVNEAESTSPGPTTTSNGITLGAGGETSDLNGAVAEFITLNSTVDATTRQNIEGYLAHKWGFADKLPTDHPHYSVPPGAARISVTLNSASATDADGHPLTITWSVDSKDPADAIEPTFDDPSILQPTVTFYEPGTYVLRMTVDDGYQTTPSSDTVTITINSPSTHTLTVVNGTGGGTKNASSRVPIIADPPGEGQRFINWTTPNGGYFADPGAPSTTYTMPTNDATVTANYGPNKQPQVSAGPDQNLGIGNIPAPIAAWNFAHWTGDADSGISSSHTYTALQCFGSRNGGSVTVNGVTFPENFDSSGPGWSLGGYKRDWGNDDDAALTGESEKLGKSFIYDGKPRTITFTGLTPGKTYEATFFSVAWENSSTDRRQTFSVEGLDPAIINQNHYENNQGIRISCTYMATDTSQTITIAPETGRTLHLYAFSNRIATLPGALAFLDGSATDADGDTLTTTWSVVGKDPAGAADPTFGDASQIDTTVAFTEVGTYTLQLTANDGFGTDVIDQVIITVSAPAPFSLTVVDGTGSGTPVSGTEVEITAVAPSSSLRFTNWTTSDGGSFGDVYSATTTYTMPHNNATVTANFEANTPPVVDAGADQTEPFTGTDGETRMILSPTDSIQGFQGVVNFGNSTDGNWPRNETPQKAIDGSTGSKYLNFGKVGSGFHVSPGIGHTILTGVRIITANDVPGRDPLTVSIEGSNGGDLSLGSNWTLIQDDIDLGIGSDPGRNQSGPLVPVTASAEYSHYRVIVQSMRNPGDNSVQYAEIELHGYKPGATSFILAGSASDINSDPLTTTWSVFSKPVGAATPLFGDASLLNSPVRFTEPGTYTLRLTADDGTATVSDDVVITLDPPPTYSLTVTGGSGDGTYLAGTEVPITADAPPANQRFASWTTDDGGSFGDANASTTTYAMPGNVAVITANYETNTLPAVVAGGNQTVSISSSVPWTPAWAPSTLSTKAWYDAADEASLTITEDPILGGGTVSQWGDKSGNGNHLKQNTGTKKPYWGSPSQTMNGVNTVFFDGTDSMQQANNAFGSTISDATVFTVWEIEQIKDGTILQLDPERFTIGIRYQRSFATTVNGTMTWDSWMEWYYPELTTAANTPMMVVPRYSFSENTYRNYVNGTADVFKSGGADGGTQKKANGLVDTTGGMQLLNFRGKCGEVLVLDEALDDARRQKVEGYLAHKWGLDANLPAAHPYKTAAPVETGVVVNLAGSATDDDGDPLTITWTVDSKDPTTAADPVFENPSSPTTTVTFTEEGTYVLRLTANDGNSADQSATVTITVGPEVTSPYDTWAGGTFANAFTDTALSSNPDGDWMTNLMEFALGTDPTVRDGGPLATNGSVHGAPILVDAGGGNFEFYFMRRKDFGTSGSANYTPQFSANLASFTNSGATPTWVADSTTDPTHYEVVKVPYLEGMNFGRLEVNQAP